MGVSVKKAICRFAGLAWAVVGFADAPKAASVVREILGYVDGVANFSLGRPDAWLIDFFRDVLGEYTRYGRMNVQVHPERHQNIIVKVCGFSARFVTLSKRWQDEIIARHRLK